MRLSLDGRSLGGSTRIFLDNQVLALPGTAGNPQWWDDKPLFQLFRGKTPTDYVLATYPYNGNPVDPWGQSYMFGSAGTNYWAAQLNGFRDSRGRYESTWAVVAVDDVSPRAAVVVNGSLCVWDGATLTTVEPSGADTWATGDIHFSRGVLGYRKGGRLVTWAKGWPIPIPGQGVRFDGDYVLLWQRGRGTVLHTWSSPLGLVIDAGLNYNPDIRDLGDGKVRIVAGKNQGDEGENRYDVDWNASTVDGKFQRKMDLSVMAVEPQEPVNGKLWCGFFEFLNSASPLPGNCRLYSGPSSDRLVRTKLGNPVCRYVNADNDSDVGELEARIAESKSQFPQYPVLAYWTAQAQAIRVPRGANYVGVEAYRHVDESIVDFEVRIGRAIQMCSSGMQVWLIPQCYTSNSRNTEDLLSIPPVIARIVNYAPVKGVLIFSGSGRVTGYQDHPEVHPSWIEFASRLTTPVLPIIVTPQPPPIQSPVPVQPPVIQPPVQENPVPLPIVGQRGAYRALGTNNSLIAATVIECQDKGFVSLRKDSNGRVVHFDPHNGAEDGDRSESTGTGEERIKFQTDNVFVSRSGDIDNGPMQPFEWYSR